MAPRPWSELEDATKWTEEVDGFVYTLREPSIVRLMSKDVSLPVVEVKEGRVLSRTAEGREKKFYLSEAEQAVILADCLVEPKIHEGRGEPVEGSVRLHVLGSHADVLVLAIIKRIYGGALVRAATFRSEQPEGTVGDPDGAGGVDEPAGGASATAH